MCDVQGVSGCHQLFMCSHTFRVMTSSESAAWVSLDCKIVQGSEGPGMSPQQIKIEGGMK